MFTFGSRRLSFSYRFSLTRALTAIHQKHFVNKNKTKLDVSNLDNHEHFTKEEMARKDQRQYKQVIDCELYY